MIQNFAQPAIILKIEPQTLTFKIFINMGFWLQIIFICSPEQDKISGWSS